ncbi:MAG TPA: four helix bundle protein [Thermoanaerobaculia bacterium]|nr:four helix bundle protein [Thermoanaerobaculia bacterium]
MNKKDLEQRTKRFALQVIDFCDALPRARSSEVLAKQLIRSATSIGANYREANRAESRKDFIHKIAIVEKEAAETEYWLELIVERVSADNTEVRPILQESREILAIFTAIGRSTKERGDQIREDDEDVGFRISDFEFRI